ncbi:MAG: hypothetical protein GY842_02365 [bacterium]|nr:hypothetical protein [bacterium]
MQTRDPSRSLVAGAVIMTVVLMFGSVASAATIDWSDPPVGPGTDGSNDRFGWTGGGNNIDPATGPGFGDPTDHLWGFLFPAPGFRAEGGGGSGASTSDLTRVTMDRFGADQAADAFDFIYVREWGTYLGDPAGLTVQADYDVFRFSPPIPPGTTGTLDMPVTWVPDDPGNPELGGTWYADLMLVAGAVGNPPNSNVPWDTFQITVTNTIQVAGSLPAGSFVEKHGMRIVIPEPSMALFGLAGFGLIALRRSRRG